jgi:hypothetical protein
MEHETLTDNDVIAIGKALAEYDRLETLSKENKHYCAIKVVVNMKHDLSAFVADELLDVILIIMVQRLREDLKLTESDRDFLLKMAGIEDAYRTK